MNDEAFDAVAECICTLKEYDDNDAITELISKIYVALSEYISDTEEDEYTELVDCGCFDELKESIDALTESVKELKNNITPWYICMNPTYSTTPTYQYTNPWYCSKTYSA